MKRTGLAANALIWFGAAVTVAEIEAGFSVGGNWRALVLGHLFGGVMLFAVGMIGARTGRCAMECTVAAFGKPGMWFFSSLNLLQLVGWTSVMIAQGGAAFLALTGFGWALPCLALATLVGVWAFVAFGDRLHLAAIAMGLLAALAVLLTVRLFGVPRSVSYGQAGFWTAFEVSAAMPLSWLPLISDYTSKAARPFAATVVSAVSYTFASIWAYSLGMALAGAGATGVADGIVKVELGAVGLAVVAFSTITSTFLDAFSAGESVRAVLPRVSSRVTAVLACGAGGALALVGVMDLYVGFLMLISSVFAPMATVLIVDRLLRSRGGTRLNLFAWLVGFLVFRLASSSPVGPTLTAIVASAAVAFTAVAKPRLSTISSRVAHDSGKRRAREG